MIHVIFTKSLALSKSVNSVGLMLHMYLYLHFYFFGAQNIHVVSSDPDLFFMLLIQYNHAIATLENTEESGKISNF